MDLTGGGMGNEERGGGNLNITVAREEGKHIDLERIEVNPMERYMDFRAA